MDQERVYLETLNMKCVSFVGQGSPKVYPRVASFPQFRKNRKITELEYKMEYTDLCAFRHCILQNLLCKIQENSETYNRRKSWNLTFQEMEKLPLWFIPLWEWTWCHCVFNVRQDWNMHAVVSLRDYKRCRWNVGMYVGMRYDIQSIP